MAENEYPYLDAYPSLNGLTISQMSHELDRLIRRNYGQQMVCRDQEERERLRLERARLLRAKNKADATLKDR